MQIHQLNDFIGALGASAYVPVDNGQDTGKLSFRDIFGADSTETLWTGRQRLDPDATIPLAKALSEFQYVDIYYIVGGTANFNYNKHLRMPTSISKFMIDSNEPTGDIALMYYYSEVELLSNSVKVLYAGQWNWSGEAASDASHAEGRGECDIRITRIDGIKTPANSKGVIEVTPVTLTAAGWADSAQSVTLENVNASTNVIVSPDPASYEDYTSAGIRCSAQGASTLTFVCETAPTNDITVNVMIVGAGTAQ